MTGKMVPIELHILAKLTKVLISERKFRNFNKRWNREDLDGADVYIRLLDEWDEAAKVFSRYANIWYVARHGLSLS